MAVAALIFANLALILILLPIAEHAQRYFRFGWPMGLLSGGLLAGQAMWFTLWFTYSRSSLAFRMAILAIIGVVFGMGFVIGHWVATTPSTHWHLFLQADLRQLENMKFAAVGFWMFVWLVYILLLPAKRLRGISLGNPATNVAPRLRPHQVSIWDLMLWTCVVIVPLGVVRMFLLQYVAEIIFDVLIAAGFGLAFGLPVFRAAFAERRPWIWLAALVGVTVVLTYGIYEFFVLQNWWYFRRSNPQPFPEMLIVTAIACQAIYANCWALRWLGLRWLIAPKPAEGRSSAAEPSPHFTAIAPQPSNSMPEDLIGGHSL
ncbi:MAG: hypothetical protein ACR2FY_02310 [Pirellulaceae bacterium]